MLNAASTFLRGLNRFERVVTTGAFLVLITLIFADVLSRELSGAGLHWARQTGVYANIVVVMLGLGLASASGSHLRPRFADGWLPARWGPVLLRLQHGVMSLFCLAFAGVALGVVMQSASLGERSAALGVLTWPIQAVIPLAFGLAFLRHGLFAIYPSLAPAEVAESDVDIAAGRERT